MVCKNLIFWWVLFSILLSANIAQAQDQYQSLIKGIPQLSSNERIGSLELYFDTLKAKKKTAPLLSKVLRDFEAAADSLHDNALKKRINYIRRVSSAYLDPDPDKQLTVFTEAKRLYDKEKELLYSAICQHYIGQNQFLLGKYGKAFENLLKAHEKFRKTGFSKIPEIGVYMHNLALDHYFFQEYEQAIALMKNALDYPPFGPNMDIQRYNTLACSYRALNQTAKEKKYFNETYQKAVLYQDSTWMGISLGNIGHISLREKDYSTALGYYNKSLHLLKKDTLHPLLTKQAILNVAEANTLLGNYPAAWDKIASLKKVDENNQIAYFGDQQEQESYVKRYHDVLRRYYSGTGNYKAAYLHMDSLSGLSQRYLKIYNQDHIKPVHDHLKIQEQQTRIQLRDQENQLLLFRLWTSIVTAVLFLLSISFFFYRKKLKSEKEKLALISRQRTLEVEQRNTSEELREARLKLKEYVNKIRANNEAKPTNYELSEDTGSKDTDLNVSIERLRQTRILTKEDWTVFQSLFHETFPDFSHEVSRKYCEPTPAEMRYLMLQSIGMEAPEMSEVLGVSMESIRVTKHRLGKKRSAQRKPQRKESVRNLQTPKTI